MSTLHLSVSDYPVKLVTVYKSSKAEIVRAFPLKLEAGHTTVEITGLSSGIDPLSVRVSGLGDVRLIDVVCKIGDNRSALNAPDSSTEIIRRLKAEKASLEHTLRVREHEADILVQYSKTLTGEFVAPPKMVAFLEAFVEHGSKNTQATASIQEEIVKIDRAIDEEHQKLLLKTGTSNGEVSVVLRATTVATTEMLVTYVVPETVWFPSYELHATTENGRPSSKVHLHYHARISQSTGEDWTDAQLTLNTSQNDTLGKTIPALRKMQIRANSASAWATNVANSNARTFNNQFQQVQQQFQQQRQQQQQQQQQQFPQTMMMSTNPPVTNLFGPGPVRPQVGGLFGAAPGATSEGESAPTAFGSYAVAPGFAPQTQPDTSGEDNFEEVLLPLSDAHTTVTETPLAMSFSVEGKCTIPSDGLEHQVVVGILPFDATISYVAVPRADPQLYLQCQVKNTSEYRLLPGLVRVIMDNGFVSHTKINDIITGDTFDCTLGDDPVAKVTYARASKTVRSAGGAFSETFRTTTYTATTVVHNKHAFAIKDLTVKDSIPLCEDNRVKVVLRKPEGLASAKDGEEVDVGSDKKVMWEKLVDGKGGEKEGKLEWKASVGAGSKLTFEIQWEVKSPTDLVLTETVG